MLFTISHKKNSHGGHAKGIDLLQHRAIDQLVFRPQQRR